MQKQFYVTCAKCGHRELFVGPRQSVTCQRCSHDWLDADYDLEASARVWQKI